MAFLLYPEKKQIMEQNKTKAVAKPAVMPVVKIKRLDTELNLAKETRLTEIVARFIKMKLL